MSEKITIRVHLCAFRYADEPVLVREVEVPKGDYLARGTAERCELAYYYGQNDFQPVAGVRSVSVDDVVELPDDGGLFVVAGCGFEKLEGSLEEHAWKVGRTPEDGGILIRNGKVVRPPDAEPMILDDEDAMSGFQTFEQDGDDEAPETTCPHGHPCDGGPRTCGIDHGAPEPVAPETIGLATYAAELETKLIDATKERDEALAENETLRREVGRLTAERAKVRDALAGLLDGGI